MSDIDLESILAEKEFNELSDSTKKGLVNLSKSIEGVSSNEAMKIIADFYKTNLKNEKLTNTNKKALYIAITNNLDDKTKKHFDMLYNMVSKKL